MARGNDRSKRRRAGSTQRDAKHRAGGDWTTLSIPDGIEIFQPKEGTVRFDIIPFVVGEGNPYAKPGELYYERTYFTHPRIGANNESYVCPAKTLGKPCPICEYRAQLARDPDGDEGLIKSLKPKERQLFLIRIVGKDAEDKIKLYESSFHTFGKLLDKKRQDAEEDEPHITDFDDPKAGATLKVSYNEEDAGGYSYLDCYSIEFKPRTNGLDAELLDHDICLDEVVKVLPYDKLKSVFLQETEPTDDDDEPAPKKPAPKGKVKPAPKEEEDDDDDGWDDDNDEPPKKEKAKPVAKPVKPAPKEEEVELEEGQQVRHRQFGVCEIVRIADDGSLSLTSSEGKKYKGVDPKNVRPLAPPSKPAKPAPKEEEDDDDWDDDDEPAPKKPAPKGKAKPAPKEEEDDDDGWD